MGGVRGEPFWTKMMPVCERHHGVVQMTDWFDCPSDYPNRNGCRCRRIPVNPVEEMKACNGRDSHDSGNRTNGRMSWASVSRNF